jgi:beta-N-acetylhexosaminidase
MKRFLRIVFILLIVIVIYGFFPLYSSPSVGKPPSTPDISVLIHKIIDSANSGKLPEEPFVVGKTDIFAVEHDWAAPSDISKTSQGIYAAFDTHSTVFGYYRKSPIFDIRSYAKSVQTITLNDVKKVMGEPDDISHYNVGVTHQQILIYQVQNGNQLKWVMDMPNGQTSNPKIDHISLYNLQIAKNSIYAEVNSMSLDEKIGQLFMVGIDGTVPGADAKMMIEQKHVGGIILYGKNMASANQIVQFTNQLKALNKKAHNPEPLFLSVDQEGGKVDRMPSPILKMPSNAAVGKVDKPTYSYQVGQVLGKECASLGFNLDYAPVIDIITNSQQSAIGDRSFGSNPTMVSLLGTSTMKGIQSQKIISVMKHFPGYGSVSIDVHIDLATVKYGLQTFEKVDWVPYKDAMTHGADMVMVTHLLVPKLDTTYPASMSQKIITGQLRNNLGFKGVIITDDMTMGAIEKNYSIQTAALKAVEAGADIVLVAYHEGQQESAIAAIKAAVENGTISEDRIDDSVYRIIQLKQKYNLSDQSIKNPDIGALNEEIQHVVSTQQSRPFSPH